MITGKSKSFHHQQKGLIIIHYELRTLIICFVNILKSCRGGLRVSGIFNGGPQGGS